jgi:hypothetical protein
LGAAAHLVQLSYQGGDTHVKPHSLSCDTRYDHPNPTGEKAMPVADLLRTILTPAQTQVADLGVPPALYVPPQTQLADLGERRARNAPPHAQVADLGVLQTLFALPRTKVADLGARRARYAPPHPQVVDLRVLQALFARPRVASQHSPIKYGAANPLGVKQGESVARPTNVKIRAVATTGSDDHSSRKRSVSQTRYKSTAILMVQLEKASAGGSLDKAIEARRADEGSIILTPSGIHHFSCRRRSFVTELARTDGSRRDLCWSSQ